MNDITVQDIFLRFYEDFRKLHSVSPGQDRTALCIMKCKTPEMGANVSECPECHLRKIHYNSCRNRFCTMCQAMDVDKWIDLQQENVLDVPYFHAVFTIPEELYALTYSNQKLLYDTMYHAVSSTLKELSSDSKHLGARIGFICVLHTWGSKMNYHPHIHTIILGGGLDERNHWKDKGKKFFFPVKVLSAVFKKYYLQELKMLREKELLEYHGSANTFMNHYAFKELLDLCYEKKWISYIKPAFQGASSVIHYLGRYTHRIAISNRRIVEMDEKNVTYLVKDYKNKGHWKSITIPGTEFIRRFLMHVLPKGFVRLRHYGILSCRIKKDKMTLCRNLLGCRQYLSKLRGMNTEQVMMALYHIDICKCPECGAHMSSYRMRGHYMLC
ncbi:MAG: IS91 family transposase [Anaerostipes sp.]|uniref:Transposase zinc-binding domain-containing protein n=1 Tax=Hespellia stercorisuis DSM 15480 TaxID=1121950 RepID=A0A1M6VMY7_9FIRM|nr:IS91 family transposase [Hespellia stercorisuis]MDD3186837.1 IS91 family transposase [Anaerostipes sp.]MDD3747582.1 IS91 family transposase [Anaerostipes sp.]MDD3747586.1 IS91 family transposase [Anaerostipes sp.]SHK82606.1 Transposase zinc-binding domain-containing protein [Hespellia stercorisuis DSM 15480]